MKGSNNVCGVENIKKFYFRELDNDYYVFGCKWTGCEFVTHNSESIKQHVQNQHLCPHAVAINGSSKGNSVDNNHLQFSHGCNTFSTEYLTAFPILLSALMNGSSSSINYKKSDVAADQSLQQTVNGQLARQIICRQFLENLNDNSNANQIIPILQNNNRNFDIIPANNSNILNESLSRNSGDNNHRQFSPESDNFLVNDVMQPINEIIEIKVDPQSFAMKSDDYDFNPFTLSAFETEVDENLYDQKICGFYSLENYLDLFIKVMIDGKIFFRCNCTDFTTKNQISLVRHIWTHIGRSDMRNDINGSTESSDSKLNKKAEHNLNANSAKSDEQKGSIYSITDTSELAGTSGCNIFLTENLTAFPITLSAYLNGSSSLINYKKSGVAADQSLQPTVYGISSRQIICQPFLKNLNDNSNANQNIPILQNNNRNFDIIPANNSNLLNESISIIESLDEDNNYGKSIGFERSFSPDDSNSALSSLKNYNEFISKVKGYEEFTYKFSVSDFRSRAQVSLNRQIWTHTGFECDITGCSERFNSETELYIHHNTHSNHSLSTIQTSIFPASNTNFSAVSNQFANGSKYMQKTEKIKIIGRSARKIMASMPTKGLYSLKKFKNFYKKVRTDQGFKFYCNCGQFETEYQSNFVRHIWSHKITECDRIYSYNGNNSAQNTEKYSETVPQTDGSFLYKCKWIYCCYQSLRKGNIIQHIRSHTGDKPYICQLNGCGRSFAYLRAVKLHQQKDH